MRVSEIRVNQIRVNQIRVNQGLGVSQDKIFVKYSFVRCPVVHDMCQERKLFIRPLALLYI